MSRHWFRGNLHTHTTNSDGDLPPDVVTAWYRDAGYDFLALTDHDLLTHPDSVKHAAGEMLLIRGEELTSGHAHVNAFGISAALPPRYGEDVRETLQLDIDFDPGGRRRAIAQPPQLRLAGLALGYGAAREPDAVRGVQRRP